MLERRNRRMICEQKDMIYKSGCYYFLQEDTLKDKVVEQYKGRQNRGTIRQSTKQENNILVDEIKE